MGWPLGPGARIQLIPKPCRKTSAQKDYSKNRSRFAIVGRRVYIEAMPLKPIEVPPAVARYRARVLVAAGGGDGVFGSINTRLARLGMLRLLARRQMADRQRFHRGPDAVVLLYTEIMRAADLSLR